MAGYNFKRILVFLKKDKLYVIQRLRQELTFRFNKFRYRFPSCLIKNSSTPGMKFFTSVEISNLKLSSQIVASADDILNQTFDLLGSGKVDLVKIDWSMDFKSNFTWPLKYCHDYAYNDLDISNDVKIPWELSRLQFLPTLAQAYVITKESKYLDKIDWYLSDWEKNNPFAYSINWACTMDVALRTISILTTINLLDANSVDILRFKKFDRLLLLHGLFISENLEKSDVNGNHYLADLVGLLWAGIYFKKNRWIEVAQKELELEINNQLYSDGSDFEASIPYHRLVLELFFLAYRASELNGAKLSDSYRKKLSLSFKFVSHYIKPDGMIPIIGDNDNGRAFILGTEDLNDHRYLLEIGQAFNPDQDILPFNISTDYCTWLNFALPSPKKEFPETWFSENYFVKKNHLSYLFLEMSPIGLGGRGGHGHSDTGTFELMLSGVNVFVDSGCYSYTSDYKRRNKFRSTEAHNIIQLDNVELFPFIEERNLWNLVNTINTKSIAVTDSEIVISHDGYGCAYQRTITLVDDNWSMKDSLKQFKNRSKLSSRFHLHPDAKARLISEEKVHISHKSKHFEFFVKKGAKFALNIEPCEISSHFGKLQNSSLIIVSASLVGLESIELEYELKEVECSRQS